MKKGGANTIIIENEREYGSYLPKLVNEEDLRSIITSEKGKKAMLIVENNWQDIDENLCLNSFFNLNN